MQFFQKEIQIAPKKRGFHLISDEIEDFCFNELSKIQIGQLNLFIKHTSASLSINENADSSVRGDMEAYFSDIVSNKPYFKHTYEGADDMPAHIKATMIGASLNIPITNGRLNLGTWQGIYLCEHRDFGGSRNLIITIMGT